MRDVAGGFKGSAHKPAAREAIKKSFLQPAAAPLPRAQGLGFALLYQAFGNTFPKSPCLLISSLHLFLRFSYLICDEM